MMMRIELYWKNEGGGVCYNLCFPLARLATTTRNQPYSMKTLMTMIIMTMAGMTLKMAEIELMSGALEAGCSIYSLHNSQFVQQPCRWPPASLPLVTALYNLHKSHKFYDIEEF